MDDAFGIALGVFMAALLVFCVFGMYMAGKQAREFVAKCEQRNGYVFSVKGRHVCLKNESVVAIPR